MNKNLGERQLTHVITCPRSPFLLNLSVHIHAHILDMACVFLFLSFFGFRALVYSILCLTLHMTTLKMISPRGSDGFIRLCVYV